MIIYDDKNNTNSLQKIEKNTKKKTEITYSPQPRHNYK